MKPADRPFLVGITGGIGSGKSFVCQYLQNKGYYVIFADTVAKNIRQRPQNILIIKNKFGKQILEHGLVSSIKLAETVFSQPEKLHFLNELIHPQVLAEFQAIIDSSSEKVLFFEIPLLFEIDLKDSFDLTVNISAKLTKRIERVIKRDRISRDEVLKRISSQMTDEEKRKIADITIENNSVLSDLKNKVDLLLKQIPNIPFKDVVRIFPK